MLRSYMFIYLLHLKEICPSSFISVYNARPSLSDYTFLAHESSPSIKPFTLSYKSSNTIKISTGSLLNFSVNDNGSQNQSSAFQILSISSGYAYIIGLLSNKVIWILPYTYPANNMANGTSRNFFLNAALNANKTFLYSRGLLAQQNPTLIPRLKYIQVYEPNKTISSYFLTQGCCNVSIHTLGVYTISPTFFVYLGDGSPLYPYDVLTLYVTIGIPSIASINSVTCGLSCIGVIVLLFIIVPIFICCLCFVVMRITQLRIDGDSDDLFFDAVAAVEVTAAELPIEVVACAEPVHCVLELSPNHSEAQHAAPAGAVFINNAYATGSGNSFWRLHWLLGNAPGRQDMNETERVVGDLYVLAEAPPVVGHSVPPFFLMRA